MSDIKMRIYTGSGKVNLSQTIENKIKGLLFDKFGSGDSNKLEGNISSFTYDMIVEAMDKYADAEVTRLEFEVFDLSNNKLTITLYIGRE